MFLDCTYSPKSSIYCETYVIGNLPALFNKEKAPSLCILLTIQYMETVLRISSSVNTSFLSRTGITTQNIYDKLRKVLKINKTRAGTILFMQRSLTN